MEVLTRVKLRLNGNDVSDELLNELVTTSKDRLLLRLEVNELPERFTSILVDVTIKMYRKMYFEGITNESVEGISTHFVDDILAEYNEEIESFRRTNNTSKVRFI